MKTLFAALALALASCGPSNTDPRPTSDQISPTGHIVDRANLLDPEAERALTDRLTSLEGQTTDQVAVVTVLTLDNIPIDQYALDLFNRWGIGRADVDNGVLLLVAPNERKVRISVGYGLEGLLTDDRAAGIVSHMLPLLKKGDHSAAIRLGVEEIEALLRSDLRRPQPKREEAMKAA